MQNDRAALEMKIETAELRRLLADPPALERLATGFSFTEGPVWFSDGSYLIFSDIPETTLYRWDEQSGVSVFRKPSGFANGNTRDLEGRLLTCEHSNRRVSRTEHDGTITVIASHYGGKRLNSPNDIVVKSDGMIYFTDPTYGLDPREGDGGPQELGWQGVYRVAPDGSGLTLLADDFTAPNGLVFSPDERQLYVDDSEDMFVKVFDVRPDGTLTGGTIIAQNMGGDADRRGVPDGMKVDVEGRLWATGPGGVWVMEPDGRLIDVLPVPEVAANLNWGGPDRRTLYITASTSLYRVRITVTGAPER